MSQGAHPRTPSRVHANRPIPRRSQPLCPSHRIHPAPVCTVTANHSQGEVCFPFTPSTLNQKPSTIPIPLTFPSLSSHFVPIALLFGHSSSTTCIPPVA